MADTQVKTPEFSKSIAEKYKISGVLQPSKTHFGAKYGNTTIDLANAPVEVVDAFCKKYDKQPYFTLKSAASATKP